MIHTGQVFRWHSIRPAITISALIILTSSCSTQAAPNQTSAAPTVATTTEAPGSDFNGPVVWECEPEADPSVTYVKKLNLSTGEVVNTGKTFPLSGCHAANSSFGVQRTEQLWNPDETQRVWEDSDEYQVGYQDIQTGEVTNITNILAPTVGDFQKKPRHSNPLFDRDGMLVFLDHDALGTNSGEWKWFDPKTQNIVKTQTGFPGMPGPVNSASFSGFLGPNGEVEPIRQTTGGLSVLDSVLCGKPIRWLDDKRYLAIGDAEEGFATALYLAEFHPGNRDVIACTNAISPTLKRSVGAIKDAIMDPAGNVYFSMSGSNGLALYQANLADPAQPKKLPFKGTFWVNGHETPRSFASWE